MPNAQVVRITASMPKSWLTEAQENTANALASMDSDSVIDLDNVNVDNVGNPCWDSMGCTDQGCNNKGSQSLQKSRWKNCSRSRL